MRSGVSGRSGKRTPVALASALAIAGATGLMRALALRLGAQRPDRVVGVGEDRSRCAARRRRPGCGSCAAAGFTIVPVCVVDHLLVQRPAEAHGDGAVELAAALHRD